MGAIQTTPLIYFILLKKIDMYIAGLDGDGTLRIAKIPENTEDVEKYVEEKLGFDQREQIIDVNILEGKNIVGYKNIEKVFEYILEE